jgi:hypothetical protein
MRMIVAACVGLSLLTANALRAEPAQAHIYAPSFEMDTEPTGQPVPYVPQPGDIFLATDNLLFNRVGHWLAGSGAPHHSGLVVALPDGRMGLLESGPLNTFHVRITQDMVGHFCTHEKKGERVWIRRRAIQLTPEESQKLTEWAMAQDGKWFAAFRLVGQLTPFRSRGPIRSQWMGKPHGPQNSYFCSELVLESCVAAGLLDPERTRPRCTYPRDLFYGTCPIQFVNDRLDINRSWLPPARLTCYPEGRAPNGDIQPAGDIRPASATRSTGDR